MTNFPSVVFQHVHDKHTKKNSQPKPNKVTKNTTKQEEKKCKNSNSNAAANGNKEGKRRTTKKLETGKEGKWSIINFTCDFLVRFLRLPRCSQPQQDRDALEEFIST